MFIFLANGDLTSNTRVYIAVGKNLISLINRGKYITFFLFLNRINKKRDPFRKI